MPLYLAGIGVAMRADVFLVASVVALPGRHLVTDASLTRTASVPLRTCPTVATWRPSPIRISATGQHV